MSDPDRIFVEMHPDAAKKLCNVLLDTASTTTGENREWLLWSVGLIAQAHHAYPTGPDG